LALGKRGKKHEGNRTDKRDEGCLEAPFLRESIRQKNVGRGEGGSSEMGKRKRGIWEAFGKGLTGRGFVRRNWKNVLSSGQH